MSPERIRRIVELYYAAREGTPDVRAALLAETDPELRRKVELLLAQPSGGEFLDVPAFENAQELLEDSTDIEFAAGACLGPYCIESKLGEGGMGQVFRAVDTRLGRPVAIKTNRRQFSTRFKREARVIASLNHPNICTLYDVGPNYLVMELVEGETITARLKSGPIPVKTALLYASQIAAALAEAHGKGIVHRDLKPGNIMAAKSGIKVLDFGLAKVTEAAAVSSEDSTRTEPQSTEPGKVVGTAAYMSPEQAEGKKVDARSDIFSFGSMLYEMLGGRRAFRGDTPAAAMASVLRTEPPPLPSEIPGELRMVVALCLEKDPKRRWQSAEDVKIVLERLARELEAGQRETAVSAIRPSRWKRTVGASLAAAAVGAAIYWVRQPEMGSPSNLVRVTSNLGLTCSPALSADGKLLAYASDQGGQGNLHIWVKPLPDGQPIQKTQGDADDLSPAFSPDGASIVFDRTGRGVLAMPTFGDHERLVAPDGHGPQFSPDGTQVAYWAGDQASSTTSGAIFVTPFAQYAPRRIASEFAGARFPIWAPDGKHLLFLGVQTPQAAPEWWVAALDGSHAVNTGILTALQIRHLSPLPGPGDWKGSDVVFSAMDQQARHIWRATLKIPGWHLAGAVRQLTSGPGTDGEPAFGPNGRVAYSVWDYRNNLWRLALRNGKAKQEDFERLSVTGAIQLRPSISANGRTLAYLSGPLGERQVWVRDLDRGVENQLTFGPGEKSALAVAADGSMVAYSVVEDGRPRIYTVPAANTGSGPSTKVCDDCGQPSDWTHRDGKVLCSGGRPKVVSVLDTASGASVPILSKPGYDLDQPHISPDDQWIAFVASVAPNLTRIYVAPFRKAVAAETEWIPITDAKAGDDKPRWLDETSLIYYSNRDGFGCLWKQKLRPDTKQPAGAPVAVHHFHRLGQSPRTLFREDFQIAVTPDVVILNLVDSRGDIWMINPPARR